jgi:hypothetical protein
LRWQKHAQLTLTDEFNQSMLKFKHIAVNIALSCANHGRISDERHEFGLGFLFWIDATRVRSQMHGTRRGTENRMDAWFEFNLNAKKFECKTHQTKWICTQSTNKPTN